MERKLLKEICSFQVFQGLKKETYSMILEKGKVVEFNTNQLIIEEKHNVNYLYFILEGTVSIYKINVNGQKKVIYMLNKGNFLNEDLDERSSSINAEIYIKSRLLIIPKDAFYQIMENDFIFTQRIINSMSSKIRRLYRQLKNTPNSIRIEKKVAAKLYKLSKDYGVKSQNRIKIDIQISITFLADLLGSQRETVSRAVKKLQEMNLVYYKNKTFYINDINALASYFKS